MPQLTHIRLAVGLALGASSLLCDVARAADPASGSTSANVSAMTHSLAAAAPAAKPADDPYLWLEGVTDDKALTWVREQNAKAETEIAAAPAFKKLEADLLAILDSDARIPAVQKIGDLYYNFWRDKKHPRGVWRRTTLEEYRKAEPQWEIVLDIDALNASEDIPEGKQWVWHGADCLKPEYRRCLISLSPGGSDADVTREFDLETQSFVEDGFYRPMAKGGLQWIDQDTVYVFTDFGPGSLTASGYPRIVKEWKRGTPLTEAKVVYEGKPTDMYIAAFRDLTPGFERDFVNRTLAFYNDELYLRKDGKLVKIDVPNSANKSVHNTWLTVELREPWTVKGNSYVAGSLLVIDFEKFLAGDRGFDAMFVPADTVSLAGYTWTKRHLVLNLLDDVKSKVRIITPMEGTYGWHQSSLPGAPALGTVSVAPVDNDTSDALWMTASDFLTPTTLSMVEIGKKAETLKTMPPFFEAAGLVAEQKFATSKDGTRVPYFIVHRKDMPLDGANPTLLWGYGGFEVSYTATYTATVGRGWLQQGGVYVLANIRGGGEYGPRWHQAALKANRHKSYEDFAAIAEDLFAKKITSPQHLGAQGGSNGGLLMGNMIVQYPQLFGAIVCQVPLLDMKRYTKLLAGASWMAEYGDPDKPADWAYIKTFSPYHMLKADAKYPAVLFTSRTKDDRVHPGHARKMMAKMQALGADVRYFESIEGGHESAVDNAQDAHIRALSYMFLWERLKR